MFYEALDTYSLWPSSEGFGYLWIVSTLMKIFSYDKEIGMESIGPVVQGRRKEVPDHTLSSQHPWRRKRERMTGQGNKHLGFRKFHLSTECGK